VCRVSSTHWFRFQWPRVTCNLYRFKDHGVTIDAFVLCAQITRDLFAIAKFLQLFCTDYERNVKPMINNALNHWHLPIAGNNFQQVTSKSSQFSVANSFGQCILSPIQLWICVIFGHGKATENQCWKRGDMLCTAERRLTAAEDAGDHSLSRRDQIVAA